jgi:hypothetical protein
VSYPPPRPCCLSHPGALPLNVLIYQPDDLFEATRSSTVDRYKNGFSIYIMGTLRLTDGDASTSTEELRGATMFFYSDEAVIGHTTLTQLQVNFESGQCLFMDDGAVSPVEDASRRSPHTLNFRYVIPGSFFSS